MQIFKRIHYTIVTLHILFSSLSLVAGDLHGDHHLGNMHERNEMGEEGQIYYQEESHPFLVPVAPVRSAPTPISMPESEEGAEEETVAPVKIRSAKQKKAIKAKSIKVSRKKAGKAKEIRFDKPTLKGIFKKAEIFHQTWFNLPAQQVKISLEKLTEFCRIACTKDNCSDKELANSCHLMCPSSTLRKCQDPTQKASNNAPGQQPQVQQVGTNQQMMGQQPQQQMPVVSEMGMIQPIQQPQQPQTPQGQEQPPLLMDTQQMANPQLMMPPLQGSMTQN